MDYIKENVQSFKRNFYKDFNKKITDKEAYDALFNFVGFIKVMEKIDRRVKLERKLKQKYCKKEKESDNMKVDTT